MISFSLTIDVGDAGGHWMSFLRAGDITLRFVGGDGDGFHTIRRPVCGDWGVLPPLPYSSSGFCGGQTHFLPAPRQKIGNCITNHPKNVSHSYSLYRCKSSWHSFTIFPNYENFNNYETCTVWAKNSYELYEFWKKEQINIRKCGIHRNHYYDARYFK